MLLLLRLLYLSPALSAHSGQIFGPVMSILKFSSIDEVVRRANDTVYGTRERGRIEKRTTLWARLKFDQHNRAGLRSLHARRVPRPHHL